MRRVLNTIYLCGVFIIDKYVKEMEQLFVNNIFLIIKIKEKHRTKTFYRFVFLVKRE